MKKLMDFPESLKDTFRNLAFPTLLTLLLLAVVWPGGMSADAFGWLSYARAGKFLDVQPIGPTLLLRLLDPIYPGPFLFISINIALLVFTADFLFRQLILSLCLARICLVAFICFPSVLSIIGMAWRDVTGVGITLLTFLMTILFIHKRKEQKLKEWVWVILLAAMTYTGAMFRENHAAGAAPFLIAFAWQYLHAIKKPFWRLTAAACVALAFGSLLTIAAMETKHAAAENRLWFSQVGEQYLLARMSDEIGKNFFPEDMYPGLTMKKINEWMADDRPYYSVFWKAFSHGKEPLLPILDTKEENERLNAALKAAIWAYPQVYLEVRLHDILKRLDFTTSSRSGIARGFSKVDKFSQNVDINFATEKPAWSQAFMKTIKKLCRPVPMNNPLYMLVLSGLIAAASVFYLRGIPYLAVILSFASAALHYLGVAVFAFHYVFYYGYQSIVMGWLTFVLFAGCISNAFSHSRFFPKIL